MDISGRMSSYSAIKKAKTKKKLMVAAALIVAAVSAVLIGTLIAGLDQVYAPDYERLDLTAYLDDLNGEPTEEVYEVLFRHTGLGKDAVDKILGAPGDAAAVLSEYQENFFNIPEYASYKAGIVTSEEHFSGEDGKYSYGFKIADIKDGDILITKSPHTLVWRHGHAGIVIDAEKGKTLEAVFMGNPTAVQSVSKWRTYPTFIQLRHIDKGIGSAAAAIAEENFTEVPYGLFSGLFLKYNEKRPVTQCAHLPWYAYEQLGYDLDSNRIWPVTPRDVVNSEYLEIVQIFGVDPDRPWK